MAKFCGNCGAQMDDSAVICGNCGVSLGDPFGGKSTIPGVNYAMDPEKKAKMQKLIKTACAGVAALLVVIILISVVSTFTGYKGAVHKVVNAYKNENPDALANMASVALLDDYGSTDDVAERFEYVIDSCLDYFDDEIDGNYRISYKITDSSKLSERQIDDYVSEDNLGSIKAIRKVKVLLTAKHGRKTAVKRITVYLTKESGSWKLLSISY